MIFCDLSHSVVERPGMVAKSLSLESSILFRYWQNINLFPSTGTKDDDYEAWKPQSRKMEGTKISSLYWGCYEAASKRLCLLSMSTRRRKKLLRNDLAEKTTDLTVKHDDSLSLSSLSSYEIVRNLLTVFGQLRTTTTVEEAKRRQQHSQIRQKMHWTWIKNFCFFVTLNSKLKEKAYLF